MCEEIGINLSCYRCNPDRDEMLQKWNELSTYNTSKHCLSYINLCVFKKKKQSSMCINV